MRRESPGTPPHIAPRAPPPAPPGGPGRGGSERPGPPPTGPRRRKRRPPAGRWGRAGRGGRRSLPAPGGPGVAAPRPRSPCTDRPGAAAAPTRSRRHLPPPGTALLRPPREGFLANHLPGNGMDEEDELRLARGVPKADGDPQPLSKIGVLGWRRSQRGSGVAAAAAATTGGPAPTPRPPGGASPGVPSWLQPPRDQQLPLEPNNCSVLCCAVSVAAGPPFVGTCCGESLPLITALPALRLLITAWHRRPDPRPDTPKATRGSRRGAGALRSHPGTPRLPPAPGALQVEGAGVGLGGPEGSPGLGDTRGHPQGHRGSGQARKSRGKQRGRGRWVSVPGTRGQPRVGRGRGSVAPGPDPDSVPAPRGGTPELAGDIPNGIVTSQGRHPALGTLRGQPGLAGDIPNGIATRAADPRRRPRNATTIPSSPGIVPTAPPPRVSGSPPGSHQHPQQVQRHPSVTPSGPSGRPAGTPEVSPRDGATQTAQPCGTRGRAPSGTPPGHPDCVISTHRRGRAHTDVLGARDELRHATRTYPRCCRTRGPPTGPPGGSRGRGCPDRRLRRGRGGPTARSGPGKSLLATPPHPLATGAPGTRRCVPPAPVSSATPSPRDRDSSRGAETPPGVPSPRSGAESREGLHRLDPPPPPTPAATGAAPFPSPKIPGELRCGSGKRCRGPCGGDDPEPTAPPDPAASPRHRGTPPGLTASPQNRGIPRARGPGSHRRPRPPPVGAAGAGGSGARPAPPRGEAPAGLGDGAGPPLPSPGRDSRDASPAAASVSLR
ncbi:basic proline-rich protein-like [Corvus hawaiiensis]|uniref:basic proline-rich protein-like n=1 Tax=Corvus hawaiiensis TaxID=134902 RepID=UPI002018AA1F|nr:basic proline-rich protein-like [Corvus hawaiiensis]